MTQTDNKPELFDPGCERATKFHDEISQIPEEQLDESHFALCLAIESHKEHTHAHTPDCFVNRQVH